MAVTCSRSGNIHLLLTTSALTYNLTARVYTLRHIGRYVLYHILVFTMTFSPVCQGRAVDVWKPDVILPLATARSNGFITLPKWIFTLEPSVY